MSDSLISVIAGELEELLEPITLAVDDTGWRGRFLGTIGINADVNVASLVNALREVLDLKQQLVSLGSNESPSFDEIAGVLNAASNVFNAVRGIDSASGLGPAFENLAADLVQSLVTSHLCNAHPLLYGLMRLFTVIEPAETAEPIAGVLSGDDVLRVPVLADRIHPKRVIDLLRNPIGTLKAYYVNELATVDDANMMADKLFPHISDVLTELGVANRYGLPERDIAAYGDAGPLLDHALTIFLAEKVAGAPADIGFTLALSSADRGDLGLVVTPFGVLTMTMEEGKWKFELDFTADVEAFSYGKNGFVLVAGTSTTEINGAFFATLAAPDSGPAFILGSPTGTRLEIGGAEIKFATSLSEAEQTLAISGDVSRSGIVIARGDGDSFINSILPADGMKAEFDLGLAWSNAGGFSLRGGTGLEATFPIGRTVAGITLSSAHVSLLAQDARLLTETSLTMSVALGPVQAAVDRVGLVTALSFPDNGGNLGVADLDFAFKPPSGLGLAIDAAAIIGGGFLHFDPQTEEYSGMLDLQIEETIAVKAIGLLSTRLPDGAKGYSLLIIIMVEDFEPIPLGWGFNLTGIGGLLAINRTFDEEALRAGLRNHMLDAVLFPKDPIRNAAQIISNLNRVFPPASGHHLFGPVAQIAWGTPTLITADLAVVLELGARLRLLVLAQVSAILPKPDNDLIRLQMDAVGVIDFEQGTAALDATLHDSRLLRKFPLTGDMAMRLTWENSPAFALAVGGLHPAFHPPPNFPTLERITINLAAGDNPRLRCEAYFALTANTVQFGARAELYAAASGFSLQGETAFDVLIQLSRFSFLADFYAQLQLKRNSTNLFKVRVEGALAGPRPLHLKAKATFEILWWDVTIRVDTTLVEGEKPPLPAPVDVFPLLRDALGSPGSWVSQLPPRQRQVVTLRGDGQGTASAPVQTLLHPLGALAIKQNVVPLDLDISRFGSAAPAGARRFSITSVSLGDDDQEPQPLRDFFAPAQFIDMSDDEKLSRPSFESMTAGVVIGSDEFAISDNATDWLEMPAIEFETLIVDKRTGTTRSSQPPGQQGRYQLTPALLGKQARFGAAGNSELRRAGRARYRSTTDKYQVAREGWTIVTTDDLVVRAASVSYSEALQAMTKMKRQQPTKSDVMKIIRTSELSVA